MPRFTQICLLIAGLAAQPIFAATTLFQIGTFDSLTTEFEQEGNTYNDPRFYYEAGDYSSTTGKSGVGINATSAEILRDPGLFDESLNGFARALTSGRNVTDIFFQMDAAETTMGPLTFTTRLFSLGSGSSHDVSFFFNGVLFHSLANVTAETGIFSVTIPTTGFTFNTGSNVLSIQRTGGGATSPWIQFDALTLTVPEPSKSLLFGAGMLGLLFRRKRI